MLRRCTSYGVRQAQLKGLVQKDELNSTWYFVCHGIFWWESPKIKILNDTWQQSQQQDKRFNEPIVKNLANTLGG